MTSDLTTCCSPLLFRRCELKEEAKTSRDQGLPPPERVRPRIMDGGFRLNTEFWKPVHPHPVPYLSPLQVGIITPYRSQPIVPLMLPPLPASPAGAGGHHHTVPLAA